MFSRSRLGGQPQRGGVGKSRTTFAGFITRRPSCLINTLRGGSNKSPRLVPGGSGVWLSRRVQLSCGSRAALQYNSSSVLPIRRQLQGTPISWRLFCAICYSSRGPFSSSSSAPAEGRAAGVWLQGGLAQRGEAPAGRAATRLLLALRHLFYPLGNGGAGEGDAGGGGVAEPQRRAGGPRVSVGACPAPLRGEGGKALNCRGLVWSELPVPESSSRARAVAPCLSPRAVPGVRRAAVPAVSEGGFPGVEQDEELSP